MSECELEGCSCCDAGASDLWTVICRVAPSIGATALNEIEHAVRQYLVLQRRQPQPQPNPRLKRYGYGYP
jgi:hypothetical protein